MSTTNQLAEEGYLRLNQIIGDKKSEPPVSPLIPVGKSHWYKGIQEGIYPEPKHVGRLSLWSIRDILRLMVRIDAGELAEKDALRRVQNQTAKQK